MMLVFRNQTCLWTSEHDLCSNMLECSADNSWVSSITSDLAQRYRKIPEIPSICWAGKNIFVRRSWLMLTLLFSGSYTRA